MGGLPQAGTIFTHLVCVPYAAVVAVAEPRVESVLQGPRVLKTMPGLGPSPTTYAVELKYMHTEKPEVQKFSMQLCVSLGAAADVVAADVVGADGGSITVVVTVTKVVTVCRALAPTASAEARMAKVLAGSISTRGQLWLALWRRSEG